MRNTQIKQLAVQLIEDAKTQNWSEFREHLQIDNTPGPTLTVLIRELATTAAELADINYMLTLNNPDAIAVAAENDRASNPKFEILRKLLPKSSKEQIG